MKIIVLGHGKPYDFKTNDGNQLVGVKISYINDVPSNTNGTRGYLPLQESVDPLALNDLKELPGVYEAEYGMKPGAGNKPVAFIKSLKFIKSIKFEV